MWVKVVGYLPSLAAGLLILIFGFIVCWLVQRLTARVMLLLRLDRAFRNFRWAQGLEHADTKYALARMAGNLVAVLLFFVFLENAFVVWGLDVLGQLIGRLVFYLPHLVVGGLVMAIGSVVVALVSDRVRAGLAVEGFERAGLVARLTRWALMVVVTAFALEELGIAPHTVQAAVKIGLGTLGIVAALAVGLGSKDAIAAMWASILDNRKTDSGEKPT